MSPAPIPPNRSRPPCRIYRLYENLPAEVSLTIIRAQSDFLFRCHSKPQLWLDAAYVTVRRNGLIVSADITVAVAMNSDGWQEVPSGHRTIGGPGPRLAIGRGRPSRTAAGCRPHHRSRSECRDCVRPGSSGCNRRNISPPDGDVTVFAIAFLTGCANNAASNAVTLSWLKPQAMKNLALALLRGDRVPAGDG